MNLYTIAIIVTILWLGVMVFYVASSRQQRALQEEIEELQQTLDESVSAQDRSESNQ